MIKKKTILDLIILLAIYPIVAFHRLWANMPVHKVDWFLFKDREQDVQWYVKDTCGLIAFCLSFLLLYRRTKNEHWLFRRLTLFTLIISIFDIAHYWLAFNSWYEVAYIIPILLTFIAIIRYEKRNTPI